MKPKEIFVFFRFCAKCGERFKPNCKNGKLCDKCHQNAIVVKNWKGKKGRGK